MCLGDCRAATRTANREDLLWKKGHSDTLGISTLWSTAKSGPPPDFVNEVSLEHNHTFTYIFSMAVLYYNMRVK